MLLMGRVGMAMSAFAAGVLLTACASVSASPGPAAVTATRAAISNMIVAGNPNGHAYVPPAARAVNTSQPNHVIGNGTPGSCTSAAVVKAVGEGGVITFSCGPKPVIITMTATAKVVNTSRRVVLDGGGLVTLNGSDEHQIIYMNTCDGKQLLTTDDCWDQEWPALIVQNMGFENGYSGVRETGKSYYGGGAIFAEGGQLTVVNSRFTHNGCFDYGPDLGGAAIRTLGQWRNRPAYITSDTFEGGRCSNGSALSSIQTNWDVFNSVMTDNRAIGWGANPSSPGTPGGGSGGAIYTDGNSYNVLIEGTIISNNSAREGGGGVFFVVDNNQGTLTIKDSTLHNNPSGEFFTAGYPGIFFHSRGHPVVIDSTLN